MAFSEERESVAATRGFAPFTDTSGGASVALSGGDVTEGGEEANVCNMGPGWTGGGGARYLTLVDPGCGAGEVCFAGDTPEGTGGAGDLSDLGFGVSGFGGESISEAWDIWGPDEDSG